MARENTVLLYGWVSSRPRPSEGRKDCRFYLYTKRRAYATEELLLRGKDLEDHILVITRNRYLADGILDGLSVEGMEDCADYRDPGYTGYLVFVKGTLCTRPEPAEYICEHCGQITTHENTVVYIDPIHIKKCGGGRPVSMEQAQEDIEKHIEIGNFCLLYGALWRDPEVYDGGIGECKFPVKAMRKRHIWEDPDDKKADYPWVRVFGKNYSEYGDNLHAGSTVYIDGAVQARTYTGKKIFCEHCGDIIEVPGETAEVIPYLLKYQNGCGTEEGGPAEDTGPDENTAFFYGWISREPTVLEKDEQYYPLCIMLRLRVSRRAYEADDIFTRGVTRKDTVYVITRNRKIIKSIIDECSAPQPRPEGDDADNVPYMGYMVFVKGTLCVKNGRRRHTCPCCGNTVASDGSIIYVDPSGIWAEEGPVDEVGAERLLHDNQEISNMAWVLGTVAEAPYFYAGRTTECQFPIRMQRIRRKWDEPKDGPPDIAIVKTSGARAVEYNAALHEGSHVFINGAVRMKRMRDISIYCGECGNITEVSGDVMEIIPHQVEYHSDCDIPESYIEEEV